MGGSAGQLPRQEGSNHLLEVELKAALTIEKPLSPVHARLEASPRARPGSGLSSICVRRASTLRLAAREAGQLAYLRSM